MHEWALAESILAAAIEAAKKEKIKKITEITVGLGELQQIEIDIFKFALDGLKKDHKKEIGDIKIKIKTIESNLKCNNCENEWKFSEMKKKISDDEGEAIHFIPEVAFVHTRCPKCGSPDFQITTGRGVSITQIKGEK
jgi:hydrogenase nickel incorporation protein HypA/HybF